MVCLVTLLALIPLYYILRYIWELFTVSDYKHKAIFITGCDTGFGRSLALKCAESGFHVFAGCLTTKGEEALKASYMGHENGKLDTVPLDVASDESVQKAHDFVVKNLPEDTKLWGIVNNAGIFSVYGPDDWLSIGDYKTALDINTLGVIRVTQAFKKLIKKSEGRIVTVTSVNGRLSSPASGPYVVSKFGAEAYMDAIRQELYHFNVKVSILEPGIFRTPLLDQQAMLDRVEKVWSRLDEETKEEYGDKFKNHFGYQWNKVYTSMSSTNISLVVDNYFHALTAKFPRHRYYCGYDAIFMYVPLSIIPSWITDALVRLIAKQEVVPAIMEKKLKSA